MNLNLSALVALGPMEMVIILAVIVLLFGAAKLPELARGSGRALRIFKAETKGLMDKEEEQPEIRAEQVTDEPRRDDSSA